MNPIVKLLSTAVFTVLAYTLFAILRRYYRLWKSPLRQIRGPPSSGLIFGNLKEIRKADNATLHEKWVNEYGPVICYTGFFGMARLYTTDLKALRHILNNSQTYQKPEIARAALGRLLGAGVLIAEEPLSGEDHKRQRKIMNPAFGPAQIREATEVMFEKAIKLKDLWQLQVDAQGESTKINVITGLGRAALDVISTAGFDYDMNSLDEEKPSELSKAFTFIFTFDQQLPLLELLHVFFPPLRVFATERSKQIKKAVTIMGKIGRDLVRASKAEALAEKSTLNSSVARRDLLSLLIRSNLSQDIPEHQRLSDEEVISQIPTFLVAGHETTSTATSFALLALSERPDVQIKLREELWTVSSDMPSMEELDALPYLDAVVRETLRVHPPVPNSLRKCMNDDAIPVSTPFTDKKGQVHDFIPVEKGDTIFVPITAINRSKEIWGQDASEFKPERWSNLPEAVSAIPGLLNMLSFLGGPRACIGYRFSIVEIKALLFTLVRAFEFELAVPQEDIVKRMSAAVQRPMLKSDPKAGSQLPLIIKRYREA